MEGEGPITTQHSSWGLYCFLACLFLVAPIASAQQPQQRSPLVLEARVGWDSAVRIGDWTPVAVWLDWRGDREIQGLVRVRTAGGPGHTAESWVTLSPPSRKRVDFTIPFRQEADEIVVEFLSRGRDQPVEIRRSPRNWLAEDDILLVVVSRGGGVPPSAHQWCREYSRGTKGREAVAVGVDPRDLPRRWADYEPADLLVLQEFGDAGLDPDAADAIARWISVGGRVLVTAESDPAVFEKTPLWDLLPVTPGPVRLLGSFPGPFSESPGAAAPPGKSADSGAVFSRSFTARTGIETTVWPADSGSTTFVGRSAGAGWIGFSPLAPSLEPLDDGDAGARFWANAFRFSGSAGRPLLAVSPLSSDRSPMFRGRPGAPDGQSFPLAALAGYLFFYFALVGPANYFFLRRKKRFELVWITVPVLSAAFFLFAYLGGRILWGTRAAVREITIVETFRPLQDGGAVSPARSVSRIRVNSPSRSAYDVEFPDRAVYLTETLPNNPDAVKEHGFRAVTDSGTRVDNLRVNMWSSRFLCGHEVTDVSGAIRGTAEIAEGMIRGRVDAELPFSFDAARVYFKGESTRISLADGTGARKQGKQYGSYELKRTIDRRVRTYTRYIDMPRSDLDEPETVLNQALYYLESSYKIRESGTPYFIGVRAEPSGSLLVNGREPEGSRFTVYVAALSFVTGGGEVDIPPDLWREKFRDPKRFVTAEYNTLFVRAGEVEWDFFGPATLNDVSVRELKIMAHTGLLGLSDRFEILDHTSGQWVSLPRKGPAQDNMTEVRPPGTGDLGRFVEPTTMRVAIRMNLAKSERIERKDARPGYPGYYYGMPELTRGLVKIHLRGVARPKEQSAEAPKNP